MFIQNSFGKFKKIIKEDWKKGILDFVKEKNASLSFGSLYSSGKLDFEYDVKMNEVTIYSVDRIEPFGFTKVKKWPQNWDANGLEIDKLYFTNSNRLGKITNCKINDLILMYPVNSFQFDFSQAQTISLYTKNAKIAKFVVDKSFTYKIKFENGSHLTFLYFKNLIVQAFSRHAGPLNNYELIDGSLFMEIDEFFPEYDQEIEI